MRLIHRPTDAGDWKHFLADPDKHWKPGYSAHCLACCWEGSDGLSPVVRAAFQASDRYREIEPLLAIPEAKVDLPGGPSLSALRSE